jgi:toxin FitB
LRCLLDTCVIPVSVEVAERWGSLSGAAEALGRPIPVIDGLLAASAIVSGLTLVTRNAGHFADTGVAVLDPWAAV